MLKIIRKIINRVYNLFSEMCLDIYFRLEKKKHFAFNGKRIPYFHHTYNRAWENERAIEISIIQYLLRNVKEKQILEIGNVLSNYKIKIRRDVLDKYDGDPDLIKADIVDFLPVFKYDVVVCISTLEHVGWDEEQKDPNKIHLTLKNIKKNILKTDGVGIFTLPLGYNPYFDAYVKSGKTLFSNMYFYKRISENNEWTEYDYEKNKKYEFGTPYNNANTMVIGIL